MELTGTALALSSDIHGNRWALEAVIADIQARGIREILDLGDSLYGPLDPAGTAEILLDLGVPSIRGNEDRLLLFPDRRSPTVDFTRKVLRPAHLEWLEALAPDRVTHCSLFLCHGTPTRDDRYLLRQVTPSGVIPRADEALQRELQRVTQPVVLCGHDHLPGTARLPDGRLIVNPGSVGLQAYTDDSPLPHEIQAGTPQARYAILSPSTSGWRCEFVALDYDWDRAAEAALTNGRPDWSTWLRTGEARPEES